MSQKTNTKPSKDLSLPTALFKLHPSGSANSSIINMYCLQGALYKIWGFEHGEGKGEEWSRGGGGGGGVEVVTQSQILPLITTTTSRLL